MINVNKELFKGAPADERIEKETLTYKALDALGIEYMRADHDSADTIEDCREVEKVLGAEICKNLLLCNRQETVFYLLLMPGDKPFKTKDLSKQINSARLSFASADKMLKLVNITPGSLSVTGLIFDTDNRVNLLIDKELLSDEYLCCHPCINTSTLKMKMSDALEKFIPSTSHEITFVNLPWPQADEEQ
ncbi:MAG: prolyl-tRNA synthetase associated domain-containing protein [Clostridia bacterium]|nr:prolyl-tRNA synthetase associated domain-containing protein [Clostridia bacterium]